MAHTVLKHISRQTRECRCLPWTQHLLYQVDWSTQVQLQLHQAPSSNNHDTWMSIAGPRTYIMNKEAKGINKLLKPRGQPMGLCNHLLSPFFRRSIWSIKNKDRNGTHVKKIGKTIKEGLQFGILPHLGMAWHMEGGLTVIHPDTVETVNRKSMVRTQIWYPYLASIPTTIGSTDKVLDAVSLKVDLLRQ